MATIYKARFTNGVAKPLEPVDFNEGDEVLITRDLAPAVVARATDDSGDAIRRTAGAWVGHADWEEVKRILYEGRELGSRTPSGK